MYYDNHVRLFCLIVVCLLAANTVFSHVSDTKKRSEEELGLLVDNSPAQHNNNDVANHISVGEPRGFMWTYDDLLFGKVNSQLALQKDTADQSLGKRLGIEACCMYIATAGTAISAANTQLVRDIASFWPKCAASAFEAASGNTNYRVKTVNTGVCSTTAEYKTIFDAVKTVMDKVNDKNCASCCVAMSHGGAWRGELMITTDGSDPWWMDCSQVDYQHQLACKGNENGEPYCDLRSVHDEL